MRLLFSLEAREESRNGIINRVSVRMRVMEIWNHGTWFRTLDGIYVIPHSHRFASVAALFISPLLAEKATFPDLRNLQFFPYSFRIAIRGT